MTLDALIMLAGVLVLALPFLGFPVAWNSVLLVILGVLIIALGIVVRRRGNPMFAPRSSEQNPPVQDQHEETPMA